MSSYVLIKKSVVEEQEKHSEYQMLKHRLSEYRTELDGKLYSLMCIYETFGNPKGLSPFDVFAKTEQRKAIEDFQHRFPEENLIEYRDDDILVNPQLLRVYLQLVDSENNNK